MTGVFTGTLSWLQKHPRIFDRYFFTVNIVTTGFRTGIQNTGILSKMCADLGIVTWMSIKIISKISRRDPMSGKIA